MSTSELVKSVSIENLLNQREAVLTRVRQALQLLDEASQVAAAGYLGLPEFSVNVTGGRQVEIRITGSYRHSPAAIEAAVIKSVDAGAWGYLMNESGLRTFMDAKARQEWDAKVYERDVPELTGDNIRATFAALHASRGELFERGVLNVFRNLSWSYKTNQPFKLGRRIIIAHLRNAVSGGFGGVSLGLINQKRADALDDLSRVFAILDGRPEADHRNGWCQRMAAQRSLNDPEPLDEYMQVRSFRNGNAHITFKRGDLVDQMNAILAKHHPDALASEVR